MQQRPVPLGNGGRATVGGGHCESDIVPQSLAWSTARVPFGLFVGCGGRRHRVGIRGSRFACRLPKLRTPLIVLLALRLELTLECTQAYQPRILCAFAHL